MSVSATTNQAVEGGSRVVEDAVGDIVAVGGEVHEPEREQESALKHRRARRSRTHKPEKRKIMATAPLPAAVDCVWLKTALHAVNML